MAKQINVKGPIVSNNDGRFYKWLGYEACTPGDVAKALAEANGEEVEVHINSGGGDVTAGSEIYTALKSYSGRVLVRILGRAASMASVIAEAGESEISPTAHFMIHNVQTSAAGDYRTFEETADTLRSINQSIMNAYIDKTGKSVDELQAMMDRSTYLNAQEAVEAGFVDRVMEFPSGSDNTVVVADDLSGMIPEHVMAKIRDLISDKMKAAEQAENGPDLKAQALAELNLLKLRMIKRR